jgi:hypothetical protein
MTDFDTRLEGGGFGDNFEYGPAHPTNLSAKILAKIDTEDSNWKNKK